MTVQLKKNSGQEGSVYQIIVLHLVAGMSFRCSKYVTHHTIGVMERFVKALDHDGVPLNVYVLPFGLSAL